MFLGRKKVVKKEKKYLPLFKNQIIFFGTSVFVFILLLFFISFVTKTNVVTYIAERILKDLGLYTTEVRSIEIESSDYSNPGSWHINKSAKWAGLGKVEVTFDVNSIIKTEGIYKDIVLVLDVSNSIKGEKFDKVKSDSKELVSSLLSSSHNRVALITCGDTSEIISRFSNDKNDLIAKIDTLTLQNSRNYNAALLNIDSVMDGYIKETGKDVVTLFLIGGYPYVDTPNQIGTYELLKDKYPFMSINGIQYEMGLEVIKEIREITDSVWIADKSSLSNVLFESSISPVLYEKFIVTDYVDNDYFVVDSVDDIKVSFGNVILESYDGVQKIIWNLGDNSFITGGNAKMTFNLSMKEENYGYFKTNKKEAVETKLPKEELKTVNSSNTLLLKNYYEVTYDNNTPSGCSIESIPIEKYFVNENVIKKQIKLYCNGYQFKGWEIDFNDSKDIKKVNDDVFVMPEHDITIRGIWAKQSVAKSMDGTVHEKISLYKEVKNAAENGNGAELYIGNGSSVFQNKVYYYNGDIETTNNNVIFGNFCWKIVRTTETGGVKLIYNGVPSQDLKCNNTGFDTQIGIGQFNSSFKSPGQVGYMYNGTINYSSERLYNQYEVLISREDVSLTNYYYGDNIVQVGGKYRLINNDGSEVNKKLWRDNYNTLSGYYTCLNDIDKECSNVYYVVGGSIDYQYVLLITSENTLDDVRHMTLSRNITKNDDGTYTLQSPLTITKNDWFTNYNTYKNYYICQDQVSTTCEEVYSITSSHNNYYNFFSSNNNYSYGNSFIYSNGKYELTNTKQIWDLKKDYSELNNRHYTCFDGDCSTLSYIYYYSSNDGSLYYINLTEGKSVEDALNEMLKNDNINNKDSSIKEVVDLWFHNNLKDYTNMLEDTVFCNDRSISNLNGWNSNGRVITDHLYYGANGRLFTNQYDLVCKNRIDSFTTSAINGNGRLTYPVGLLTKDEADLIGISQRTTCASYWLVSPSAFRDYHADGYKVDYDGYLSDGGVDGIYGIRPLISLKPLTDYSLGNGSIDNPFIVLE